MNINWKSEKRKVSELCPAEYNPRQLTKKQIKDLSNSLKKFNVAAPIVINLNNRIIGGHQRIALLLEENVDEVDVRVPDRVLTEEEEKELNLRLNKNLGEWDFDKLAEFGEDLLKGVGFSDKEIAKGFSGIGTKEDPEVEFSREVMEENNYLVFTFDNVMDWQVAKDKFGITTVKALQDREGFEKRGVGRVLDGKVLL